MSDLGVLWLVVASLLLGCPTRSPGPDASMATLDANVVVPPKVELTLGGSSLDGGSWEVPLRTGQRPTIEVAGSLAFRSNVVLHNYRVRLLDDSDRVVESDEQESRSGPGGTEYLIAPGAPLKSGRRYALVLDGQTPGPILDGAGLPVEEGRFELQIAGERERSMPSSRSLKRRRRHR